MAVLVVALVAAANPVFAQLTSGTLAGTVKDSSGGIIPGAAVTLVSDTRGTSLPEVFTNASGDFVFVNVPPDTYTVQVAADGFKALKRSGIAVSVGDRVELGTMSIELGALSESVTVSAQAAVVNVSTGDRAFTVPTQLVENLPIANRSFTALSSLAPGVTTTGNNNTPQRIGGGGGNNIMMDGVSAVDTGSNAILLQMNVESIAEVRIVTSNYQAEFGRSSGLQITAVTKSGTNQFRGSLYSVFRNAKWNSNSKTNILNGDAKTPLDEKDLGYSIGGPIGRPGANNKLFFFYAHEYAPRSFGGDVVRYRFPTALERAGDFSQTTDNNGSLFNLIRDPLATQPCTAANTAGCFRDGGVLGRIPQDRLYQLGLNILKTYPLPNVNTPGVGYNYEATRPTYNLRAQQPAVRLDYQPMTNLRGTFKYSGWSQPNTAIIGSIPGFNDTQQYRPTVFTYATTVNYTLNSTTFIEATYGHSQNELTGCGLAQNSTGPNDCRSGFPTNNVASLSGAGLANLPMLFPNAGVIDPAYYAYEALNGVSTPIWDGTRVAMLPQFTWGNRIINAANNAPAGTPTSPPNTAFPGFLNKNATDDVSISLTKVAGRHTLKAGFYNTSSFKAQQRQGWAGAITFSNDANNPLDSGFGFSNAALGVFSTYNQLSKYVEGSFVYKNTEWYVQDNWKASSQLTLDYGVRFVHQQPQYDKLGQASNFLPDEWSRANAPALYVAACANGVYPCSGANRQAMNPLTGQLLGPNSAVSIGTLVPNTGSATNGVFLSGQGITETTYTWPALGIAPRFGMAYDVTGEQKLVLRGGAGLFFDRPSGNSIYAQVQNPPTVQNPTLRYGQLQTLGSGGLTADAPPGLNVFEYEPGLPSSTQWNGGVQIALPWSSVVDIEWVGQHSWNTAQQVNINAVDFGSAFLAQNQDRTLAASSTPGASAVTETLLRPFAGYGTIQQQWLRATRTYHSLQLSFNRRMRNGLSFGFNDTISLYDHQTPTDNTTPLRLQHNADGSYGIRDDQKDANKLFGTFIDRVHVLKANFVWDLPDVSNGNGAARQIVRALANDWQLSGVWTGATGAAYNVTFSYQSGGGNVNLTGSPDYPARVRIIGDTGSGCSSDAYRQFSAGAFAGPLTGSVGLDSGAGYLRGCFQSALDISLQRNIRVGGNKQVQFRLDVFNAPNQAIITNRNAQVNLASPTDPTNATNLPYDASGTLIQSRLQPRSAGFGVATQYQNPRTLQAQLRFAF